MRKPTDDFWSIFTMPFKLIYEFAKFFVRGKMLTSRTGAELAKPKAYKEYLNTRNDGVMLDGQRLKLSESHSFMHMLVVGKSGTHKTTGFVIPNIYERAKLNSSMLINDPKGEIHQKTVGFLQEHGYEVHIVAPEQLDISARINPLLEANNEIELEQIAETLIYADTSDKSDFWPKAAIRFVSLFAKVVKNAEYDDPAYNTLHNVLAFFQNFGDDGTPLDNIMGRYCTYRHNPLDPSLFNEWLGVTQGNKDGIQSAILTALTALRWLNNKNLVTITSRSDFSFRDMKHKKMAVFISTPPQYSTYYAAFTSILFKCAFNAFMRQMPQPNDLPVYVFHDEFATSYIPNFPEITNTIRGYGVSISAIVQSTAQLKQRYGDNQGDVIISAFNSYITFSGSDLLSTEFFKNMIGTVRERQKKELTDTVDTYREYSLLNTDEIRRLGNEQALFITKNKNPVILDYVPYFKNNRYLKYEKRSQQLALQYQQPINTNLDRIEYIPI